ncbi:MAG: hypothetical protein Q9161_001997 [Pseudevernia consocians]
MAPNSKITDLVEHIRSRLHGDLKDIKRDFNPDDKSSDARLRFDELVSQNIKKHGEEKVEEMLQSYYGKVKDIEREAKLRVWEMIYGPKPTFAERAFDWSDQEMYNHIRAQRVKAIYKNVDHAKEGKGGRKEHEPKTKRTRGQEQDKAKAGDLRHEKKRSHGRPDQETQAGGQTESTPGYGHRTEPEQGNDNKQKSAPSLQAKDSNLPRNRSRTKIASQQTGSKHPSKLSQTKTAFQQTDSIRPPNSPQTKKTSRQTTSKASNGRTQSPLQKN